MHIREILILAALSLSGCQTAPPVAPEKLLPTEATLSWANQGLGGASERVPGYVHVLRRGGPVFRDATVAMEGEILPSPLSPPVATSLPAAAIPPPQVAPAAFNPQLPPLTLAGINAVMNDGAAAKRVATDVPPVIQTAAATPEKDRLRRAWEKYCGAALGMTDWEWQAVREAGAPDNVPADLANHCIHPK